MNYRFWVILGLVMVIGFSACTSTPAGLPLPEVTNTRINTSDVKTVAQAYLDAWTRQEYAAMYRLLSSNSQLAISEDAFRKHYQSVFDEAALTEIDWEILSVLTDPDRAQVSYQVRLHSGLVGDIRRDTEMNLSLESSEWRVQWDDTLVLPELKGSNYLVMSREEYIPARANIYDYYGHALVAQADATAVGLYPDQIDPAQQDARLFRIGDFDRDSCRQAARQGCRSPCRFGLVPANCPGSGGTCERPDGNAFWFGWVGAEPVPGALLL